MKLLLHSEEVKDVGFAGENIWR